MQILNKFGGGPEILHFLWVFRWSWCPWPMDHRLTSESGEQELANLSLKGPDSKYYGLCRPYGLCHTIQTYCCHTNAALDIMWTNGCECVSVKVYLQNQATVWVWLAGCSLPTWSTAFLLSVFWPAPCCFRLLLGKVWVRIKWYWMCTC